MLKCKIIYFCGLIIGNSIFIVFYQKFSLFQTFIKQATTIGLTLSKCRARTTTVKEPVEYQYKNNFISLAEDGSLFMWDQRDGPLVLNQTNPDFIGGVNTSLGAIIYLKSLSTLIISSSLSLTSVRLDKGPPIYKTPIDKDCHYLIT